MDSGFAWAKVTIGPVLRASRVCRAVSNESQKVLASAAHALCWLYGRFVRKQSKNRGTQMAKGQAKQATNNKPKLSTKEKQAKKAEKLAKK
ncbi:MAG: hypothetical protein SF187_10995 [Deltaproteobacteria bacterium]|nr:hypothetical protein [Deltaproteobacteria bacterium]